MSEQSATRVIVVCDPDSTAAQALVQQRRWRQVEWFALRDIDHVNDAVAEGAVQTVVFGGPDEFLRALWDGWLTADQWGTTVRVEFASSDGVAADVSPAALVTAWRDWQRMRKRRRIFAALVLSLAALLAAFALVAAL
jgi:hypothetical protein